MLGLRLIGRGDGNHLDLGELMLAQHASRILTRRARFGAEAERMGGKAFRQVALDKDTVTHDIGERHLRRWDHILIVGDLVEIFLEFGKLAGAIKGVAAHHDGRGNFEIPFLQRMDIEHESAQRPLQPGDLAAGHDKARPRQLRRRREIHQAEGLAQLVMLLRLEIEGAGIANPAQLGILRLIGPVRHIGVQNIRQPAEGGVKLRLQFSLSRFQILRAAFQLRHLADQRIGITAGRLGLADLLRRRIAPRLQFLHLCLDFSPRGIKIEQRIGLRRQAASFHCRIEVLRIFPDPFQVKHVTPFRFRVDVLCIRAQPPDVQRAFCRTGFLSQICCDDPTGSGPFRPRLPRPPPPHAVSRSSGR